LRITPALRLRLKEPLGRLYKSAAEIPRGRGRLVAVGDIIAYELLGLGRVPDLLIYDCRKERTSAPKEVIARIAALDAPLLKLENPAGTIRASAWAVIREGLRRRSKIRVYGEEDLLALPAVILAEEGAVICYGQPGSGAVAVTVDAKARKAAERVITEMEEIP
jgi:uncharacterized protein (UPF0218 family)